MGCSYLPDDRPMKAILKSLFVLVPASAGVLTSFAQVEPGQTEVLGAAQTDAAVTALTSRLLESSQFTHR